MSSPSLHDDPYETLGVASSATESQIKRAWRRKTRSTGPGTVEFAAINTAAELLLDPDRRREYDTERASSKAPETAVDASAPAGRWKRFLASWNATAIFAGIVALVAAGFAIWLAIDHNSNSGSSASTADQNAAVAAAQIELPVVLSYDYRSMPADMANAERFMTPARKLKYEATMQSLINGGTFPGTTAKVIPVGQEQTVVVATVSPTSVGIISATPTTAQVGAYVKQVTTQRSGTQTHLNWVQIAMVKQGGVWLIDGVCVPTAGMTCTSSNG